MKRFSVEYERAAYVICEVDLHKHTIRLYWSRSDRTPMPVSLRPAALSGRRGWQAANSPPTPSMFDSNLKPVGLVRGTGSRTRARKHREVRQGQFSHEAERDLLHIRPWAAVVETQAFLKHGPQADLATQSGPMLVIDGRLASSFRTGAARRSKRALVWAYARMAKSYLSSLREAVSF